MLRDTKHFYAFGPFVIDTARHLVLREGKPVPLTPKTYDTLLVLVKNSGRMLSKDEMMTALWPDSSVEEANLTQQVSTIRKALAEGASRDPYIVTVPGRGYRFAGPVKEWSEEAVSAPSTPEATSSRAGKRWFKQISLSALVLAGVALVVLGGGALRGPRSLAVLPFQSLTQDPDSSFLGFSLADAIITKLDYVNSLAVRPSYAVAKYRNQAIDIPKVAAELQVDTLLTGNFIRDGDDLRITAQLVDAKTSKILWRDTFDLKYDKLLTLHDQVAQQVIGGLELSLSPSEGERLKPDKPIAPLAYEYYLRGVDLYSRSEFSVAIQMLEKSIAMDANYPLTWAQLGRAYTAAASFRFGGREQYRKAQAAYEKALSLDPAQIEAQIFMANFFTDTGRAEQAVPLLRKALRTNPNHAEAHWELGYAYRFGGMLKESVAECERARQLDPTVKLTTSALNAYLYLGQYDKFLNRLPEDIDSAFINFYRGFGAYHKKNWIQAANFFERAFEADATLFHAEIGKAISYAVRHENQKGLDILRETEARIKLRGVGDPEAIYKIAQAYSVLDDKASALRILRRSIEDGFFSYPYFASDPLLESLRSEAEFSRLMSVARQRHEAFKQALF